MDNEQGQLQELRQKLPFLSKDLQLLSEDLLRGNVPRSLWQMRYITEVALRNLCESRNVSWGKVPATIESMIGPLTAAKCIPPNIAIHVRTVQANVNPGAHAQPPAIALSDAHVLIALNALVAFLVWYATLPQNDAPTISVEADTTRGERYAARAEITVTAGAGIVASRLVPYLVDRLQQERELREALAKHFQESSRRPLLFLVYGRTEQAIHEYLERVEKASLPRALRWLEYADVVKWVNLPWIRATDWYTNAERTLGHLRKEIEMRLDLKPGAWPNGLVQAAANLRATLVFCSRLRWEFWSEAHLETLRAWALDWGQLPNLPPGNPLLVFFVTEYTPARPSLVQRLLRKRDTDHPIRQQLGQLLDIDGRGFTVTLLSELGNVTFQDVEEWILNEVKPPDQPGMIRLAYEILQDPELFTPRGLPMQGLARHLAILLEKAGKGAV